MDGPHPQPRLHGRRSECDALDRLLQRVHGGEGSALVLCGEPGVGKTALLEYLAAKASACRVARVVGVEAEMLWDDESWHAVAERAVVTARDVGALGVLPIALIYRAGVAVHAGDFDMAAALVEEADVITEASGNAPLPYTSLVLAAWRGREREGLAVIAAGARGARARGEGRAIGLAEYALAVLHNGLGR